MARRTSCPRARRASGSEPATSASPPTLTNGAASAARNRTFTAADYDRLPPFGPRKRLLGPRSRREESPEVIEGRSLAPRERERSERSGERSRPHPAESLAGAPPGADPAFLGSGRGARSLPSNRG